jgi:hypothetical protein
MIRGETASLGGVRRSVVDYVNYDKSTELCTPSPEFYAKTG